MAVQGAPAAPALTQQAAAPAGPEVPQLTYSPWTEVCAKGQEANAQPVCFTGKEGRLPDDGMMVVGAVVIEQDSSPNKLLRITVPLGMMVQAGTRVIVDQGRPMTGHFSVCLPQGCIAEFEASQELIGELKKGRGMVVQAVNGQTGGAISLSLPLPDFAKAYDGPPDRPKGPRGPLEEAREGAGEETAAATGGRSAGAKMMAMRVRLRCSRETRGRTGVGPLD
jgi:invasion protein IalB